MSAYPLYNTTYTLHRLSPLHAFPALTSATDLTHHAKSLLSILRGDVLRGVRVRDDADAEDALGRAGRLKSVAWEALPPMERDDDDDDDDDDSDDNFDPQGVAITFVYERAAYTSLLLAAPSASLASPFTSLPLLLTRLPKSLRETLLAYLAAMFDTLPSPLPLDSGTLKNMLEAWLAADPGPGKDVQLVFEAPVPSLKAITITVPRADVVRFVKRGNGLQKEQEQGGEGPFFTALRYYASTAMGLDIAALGVMKVACGGFVLGVGANGMAGKVKVFVPRAGAGGREGSGERAVEGLVKGLLEASLVAVLK